MIHTGYSFRHAVGSLADVISRVQEIGWTTAPVCDRASTFSFVKWDRMTKAAGLRPVYGVSIGVSPDPLASKPIVDWWRFLAKTSLEPLHDLLHEATRIPDRPHVSYERSASLEGVIA